MVNSSPQTKSTKFKSVKELVGSPRGTELGELDNAHKRETTTGVSRTVCKTMESHQVLRMEKQKQAER
ncbi:MAG: hypothetical protein A2Y22_01350 [Clostridiales bacterium GWD2_32_59]|nr:MAG: hypothetical protein A2Y22_01350 [Clostridiales bacterium GWD2_32_59]